MRLNATELKPLRDLLRDRFDRADFTAFLRDELDVVFERLASNTGFEEQVDEILGKLDRRGHSDALLVALKRYSEFIAWGVGARASIQQLPLVGLDSVPLKQACQLILERHSPMVNLLIDNVPHDIRYAGLADREPTVPSLPSESPLRIVLVDPPSSLD